MPDTSTTQVIDANQFAVAMGDQFARALSTIQTGTKEETRDEIVDLAGQLKSAGVPDEEIPNYIATALGIDKRSDRKVEAKISEAASEFGKKTREREFNTALNRIVKSFTKDDELLAAVKDTITSGAAKEFFNGTDAAIKVALNAWASDRGIDEDVLETLVGNEVKKIDAKRGGKKGNASPTLTPSDGNRPAGSGGSGNDATLQPGDRMLPIQEIVYDAHLSRLQRTMPFADAQKSALIAASRVKK